MIKAIVSGILFIILSVSAAIICYAGSIPEDLLYYDYAQVYFGEVAKTNGDAITIIQRKNIKGPFTANQETTYQSYIFAAAPKAGQTYLCGYFDENNPVCMWETTTFEPDTLKIKSADEMSQRMQKFLNQGLFEKKETERLQSLSAAQTATAANQTAAPNANSNHKIDTAVWITLAAVVLAILFVILKRRRKNISP